MSQSRLNASVLLVGAYERDNFGDLLFYELTANYFGRRSVAAGSIIGADMTALIGTQVHPHNDLLATKAWDLVWVVGGEVGGVDTAGALTMSLDEVEGPIFDEAGAEGRGAIAKYLSGVSPQAPAYIPILGDFALNSNAPLVLNSVGLGNMLPYGVNTGSDAGIAAISSASAVVVRDLSSHVYTRSIGVESVLSPDMVHAISVQYPDLSAPRNSSDPYFLFQSNAHYIDQVADEEIAAALAKVAIMTGWRPAFFLAGTARHHDQADQYDGIKRALRSIAPSIIPLEISTRKPLELASYIAGSSLWIGTSLHGRIIAGSYSLPRVSLNNLKVAKYAATWDPHFPVNVTFDGLIESVSEALDLAQSPASSQASIELAHHADETTRSLIKDFS